jgi:DDE_Tnp_1-associated
MPPAVTLAAHTQPDPPPSQETQEQQALLKAFLATTQHFFGGFTSLFQEVTDPRVRSLITYPLAALAFATVLMYVCHLGARRQITLLLRGNAWSAAKFQALFGVAQCPHGDTTDALFSRLDPEELQATVTGMVETLIRTKVLYPYRLLDQYFLIAIDGTGRLVYSERHCAQCLTRTHQGQTLYYHPVLEAKLVTPNGFAFSLMTEFIENPGEQPRKQDCELKAFYRLTERLKQRFPRLPICLTLDGLYAGGPTFTRCEQYGWKYLIVLQDADLVTVHQEFDALTKLTPENRLRFCTGPQSALQQDLRWVNAIGYTDSEQHEHLLAVIDCLETRSHATPPQPPSHFQWLTNFTVSDTNVLALANQGGRLRWKIENEGFNNQKHRGFELEHPYSQHPIASKVFYFLLQIAHLLFQLMEKGSLFRQAFPRGVGSGKNLALRLLEAWRTWRGNAADLESLWTTRVQIRFKPL